MALTDAALDVMGNALKGAATHASLHSANPGTTGTNATAAARQAVTWTGPSTGGDLTLSAQKTFTGGAASGAVTYVGLWSAATGGTFYGGFALTGDQAFNAAGEYTLTSLTLTGTAS